MSLAPGTRLGPYQITAQIGAGGMGEVYRAHDLKLKRDVAVKVLPESLAADADRLARFRREAELLAALNHPGIAAVYGLEESDGLTAIVMELVEGPTLADRMADGAVPVRDALPVARQIAEALAAAHEQGIVHRDLKPANVKVREDGTVKVLDFGLAKAAEAPGASAASLANSPTLTAPATEVGTVLGTAAYMAPEQARGKAVDRRADVWAFGVVLFEMLSGKRSFDGANVTDVLAAVVRDEPPFESLPADTPALIRRLLSRCLVKDRAQRLDSMRAVELDITDALSGLDDRAAGAAGSAASGRRRLAPVVAAATLVGALAGTALLSMLRPAEERDVPRPASRLSVPTPNLGGAATGMLRQVALTPDGQTLLFTAIAPDGENRTMRIDLDWTEPVVVPNIPPFLSGYVTSPDGTEFLALDTSGRQMSRHTLSGTARAFPRDITASAWTAWADDGSIWVSASNDPDRGLVHIDAAGGVSSPFGPGHAEVAIGQILPGDRTALAVGVRIGMASGPILLLDLTTGTTTTLVDAQVVEVRYSPGYLVYVQADATLQAVPFDVERLAITGEPVQIATNVSVPGTGVAQFAVAANGTVAYVPEEARSLVFVDRAGRIRPATGETRNFHAPMFSPDGRRVSTDFNTMDGRDVWLLDVESGQLARATFDRTGHDATWTPDGRSLTYTTVADEGLSLRRTRPGSAEGGDMLGTWPQLAFSGLWLPDGRGLITVANALVQNSQTDIGLIGDGGRGPIEPLVATRFAEGFPALSPDGQWLAFSSNQSGQYEVFVRPIDREEETVQVSLAGGIEPVWGPNGRELFYRSGVGGGSQMMVATVVTDPVVTISERRELFPVAEMATATPHRGYDISPDGQTFVMVRYNPSTRIMVIQNLPALVARVSASGR
jgi:serine/threonine-protein kinase